MRLHACERLCACMRVHNGHMHAGAHVDARHHCSLMKAWVCTLNIKYRLSKVVLEIAQTTVEFDVICVVTFVDVCHRAAEV